MSVDWVTRGWAWPRTDVRSANDMGYPADWQESRLNQAADVGPVLRGPGEVARPDRGLVVWEEVAPMYGLGRIFRVGLPVAEYVSGGI